MIFRAVEDTDLIRQATRGNVEAYNLLISRWEKRVYNYLLRLTRNREDALDLTQDVFLKACLLYTSPSPRDGLLSRMPSSA